MALPGEVTGDDRLRLSYGNRTTETARQPAASGSDLPPATLAICSRNRPALLLDTVRSVLAGNVLPDEIIVVDQSDAPNVALTEQPDGDRCVLRYLWSPAAGVSGARNRAIRRAAHELVALIDDDMIAPAGWFDALIRAGHAAGPDAVVTGKVLAAGDDVADGFAPSTRGDDRPATYEGEVDRDVLWTNNMVLHRSILHRIGPFDERLGPGTAFPAAEDNDFGLRLLRAGGRIIYAPEATIYHRMWRSQEAYLPLQWAYGCGQGAFYAKHFSLRNRQTLNRMGRDLLRYSYKSVRYLHRDRQQASGQTAFALGLLYGASRWLITRRPASDGTE